MEVNWCCTKYCSVKCPCSCNGTFYVQLVGFLLCPELVISSMAVFTREFYPGFNSLPVANRVPIHQWMWVESIWVTIRVGGVHTGGKIQVESGLELSCKRALVMQGELDMWNL